MWCWWMLVDREALWFRVLAARYGVEGGRLREGGQRGSSWWREITRIRERGGEPGVSWFEEHILRSVGDSGDQIAYGDRDVCSRVHSSDRWQWRPDLDTCYTVTGAYQLLTLPTKVNLVIRGVLSHTAHSCVFGCGEAESAHHLFISCSSVGYLWDSMRSWIDIPLVEFTTLRDHFV
ncbi:hypothetical protein L195_g045223 [Trifolium pratense]|uniref:Reverse transcriptase zinc-binding domain-containing protein n=1 Tax=Trifolium pratense TaxID=57577 RepID=A0A2K3MEC0_TRIPR|nr:hypothetical protein L195_g045223 [Trifolium pratense]